MNILKNNETRGNTRGVLARKNGDLLTLLRNIVRFKLPSTYYCPETFKHGSAEVLSMVEREISVFESNCEGLSGTRVFCPFHIR